MPKSINTSPQMLPVPEGVLRDLARLAKVPDEKSKFFLDEVCESVRLACERDGLVKQGLANKTGTTLLRAARDLYELLGNLNKNERQFMEEILGSRSGRIFDGISSGSLGGLRETAYQLADLFSLLTGTPPPRFPHQAPQPRRRGRRSGQVKNWLFQEFVFELLASTTVACGDIPHNKNSPGRPLTKAIKMLAPHLPHGFVPKRLPSTLERIKTRYNQIKAASDDLDQN
jgi:hypothetical protein